MTLAPSAVDARRLRTPAPDDRVEAILREIASRASVLRERLSSAYEPWAEDPQHAKQMERWRGQVAGGDEAFAKRLAWDGMGEDEVGRAVRQARLRPDAPLPAWADVLRACVAQAALGVATEERFLDANAPLPYEDLVGSFVLTGRGLLEARGAGSAHVTEAASAQLERNLLEALSTLCARTLHASFSVHALAWTGGERGSGAAAYRAFVGEMRGGGLWGFFREFSVLARLVATTVTHWVENSAALLGRLDADWKALARFLPGAQMITAISPGLSDPHRGGAMAHILTADTGTRLVYKPRDLSLFAAFQDFIRWCNARGFKPALRALDVLAREEYGWVECAEEDADLSEAQVQRYFERAGALMCAVYALNGQDLHHGNIIVSGEHPLFIDLEVMLCPVLARAPGEEGRRDRVVDDRVSNSVMATALLPAWTWVPPELGGPAHVNVGGFFGGAPVELQLPRWVDVNTDRMRLERKPVLQQMKSNMPVVDGVRVQGEAHVGDIEAGFERMYRLLLAHADALAGPNGPLHAFACVPARYMIRPTGVYGSILRRLAHPRFLRLGVDRDVELEVLARGYAALPERPPYWGVVQSEMDSLNELDIPLFRSHSDGRELLDVEGAAIGTCFLTSGFDAVVRKVRALDETDLALQRELIRSAFAKPPPSTPAAGRRQEKPAPVPALDREAAVAEAVGIADKLRRAAATTERGGVTWMTIAPTAVSRKPVYRDIEFDLHEGRSGIAVFLSALARISGDEQHRQEALAAIGPVAEWVRSGDAAREQRVGGTVGLASYAYTLSYVGQQLGDERLIEDGQRAALLVTPARIVADRAFDVVSGAAGAALGLLAAYRTAPDPRVLERALACGRHLLEHREPDPQTGLRAWRTLEGELCTGFSHGAAGIAHALAELHRASGDASFLDAALEAFAFERELFAAEAGNWHRHRTGQASTDPSALWCAWCHGAPGIGLARAASLERFGSAERADVEAAAATTAARPLTGSDHACCGAMGRAAFLATAAHALQRPDLRDVALRSAAHVVQRAHERGSYALSAQGQELLRPGFFQGLAGIGHTLLHLTHREEVPLVLLLA